MASACAWPAEMQRVRPVSTHCPEEVVRFSGSAPSDTLQLRWYRASHDRDVRIAGAWCANVGPPAVRMEPRVAYPSWTTGSGLRVASWNMELGGGNPYRFLEAELGLSCPADGSPRLRAGAPPFVLLLQEAFRYSEALPPVDEDDAIPWAIDPEREPGGFDDIVRVAERCGLAYLYVPTARNGPDDGPRPHEDMGTAVLSTQPFTGPMAFDLPVEGGRKVATAVTVRAPDGARVRLVSVHLDVASTLLRALVTGNQTRVRQARGLINGLEAAERDGPPVHATVVGGDFNTWASNESALRWMRQAFPESPEWDGRPTRGSFPPDHMFFRRGRYDRFAVASYRRIDDAYGSDHHPRVLTLTYADGPPAR